MTGLEYRVWTESSDLVYAGDSKTEAEAALGEAINDHVWNEQCHGCGVLTPQADHGFHIQICDGDQDVTGDPSV